MAYFTHTIGAKGNEHFRIEIADAKRARELQEQYERGDEIQARATNPKERARGRAMMRAAVRDARVERFVA